MVLITGNNIGFYEEFTEIPENYLQILTVIQDSEPQCIFSRRTDKTIMNYQQSLSGVHIKSIFSDPDKKG